MTGAFFNLHDMSQGIRRQLADGIATRVFPGDQAMLSVVTMEPNAEGKPHSHVEEQWGIMLEGTGVLAGDGLALTIALVARARERDERTQHRWDASDSPFGRSTSMKILPGLSICGLGGVKRGHPALVWRLQLCLEPIDLALQLHYLRI